MESQRTITEIILPTELNWGNAMFRKQEAPANGGGNFFKIKKRQCYLLAKIECWRKTLMENVAHVQTRRKRNFRHFERPLSARATRKALAAPSS
jgi:hypothetical protein